MIQQQPSSLTTELVLGAQHAAMLLPSNNLYILQVYILQVSAEWNKQPLKVWHKVTG